MSGWGQTIKLVFPELTPFVASNYSKLSNHLTGQLAGKCTGTCLKRTQTQLKRTQNQVKKDSKLSGRNCGRELSTRERPALSRGDATTQVKAFDTSGLFDSSWVATVSLAEGLRSLRSKGVRSTCGPISPCDCVKSLLSSYTGLYPQSESTWPCWTPQYRKPLDLSIIRSRNASVSLSWTKMLRGYSQWSLLVGAHGSDLFKNNFFA